MVLERRLANDARMRSTSPRCVRRVQIVFLFVVIVVVFSTVRACLRNHKHKKTVKFNNKFETLLFSPVFDLSFKAASDVVTGVLDSVVTVIVAVVADVTLVDSTVEAPVVVMGATLGTDVVVAVVEDGALVLVVVVDEFDADDVLTSWRICCSRWRRVVTPVPSPIEWP